MKRWSTIFIVGVLLAACTGRGARPEGHNQGAQPSWPTQGWEASTPEAQGMDSARLAELLGEIQQHDYGIDSISIVRHGYLVLDAYVYPFASDQRHIIHSCTKSIVSALIGIAIEQGHIESVDVPLLELLPGRTVAQAEAKRGITLEHLLTMSSGLECRDSYLYRWQGLSEMRQSDDWVQYVLDLPVAQKAGSYFEYCNGGSFLLSAILQETTGETAYAYAQEHLFDPLGISDVVWPASPDGISIGWGEMRMRPHDMLKIGYLYLHQGDWEGQQIVPAKWVAASTQKRIDGTLQDGYGYQWWIAAPNLYMALGYAGQYIIVAPEQELVVVFTSQLSERDFYLPQQLFERHIQPSIRSSGPLPEDAEGIRLLQSYVEEIAHPKE
jgi:CubicO group peptidase (beta-lactamase class C family)